MPWGFQKKKVRLWYNDRDVRKYLSDPGGIFFLEDELEWYERIRKEKEKHRVFAIIKNGSGSLAGLIGIHNIDHKNGKAEMGYFLWKDYWRMGYATEAVDVLIGKNNSGKSTLLEALLLFPDPNRNYPLADKTVQYFLGSRKSGLKSLIYEYDGTAKLRFHAGLREEFEKWTFRIPTTGSVTVLQDNSEIKTTINFEGTLYFPYDTDFIKSLDKFLIAHEEKIIKKGIHIKVAELLSKQLDERFTEMVLKKDGWYLRREDASYIHIADVGDGLKKTARIMMVSELLEPRLILWDDFDTSLHPSMIKMLLKWLAQGKWQVVLATHSIDVLYYLADLNEELDEFDAQVILLKKDQKDILHHRELNMDELEDLLEANLDPRMLVNELKI